MDDDIEAADIPGSTDSRTEYLLGHRVGSAELLQARADLRNAQADLDFYKTLLLFLAGFLLGMSLKAAARRSDD